MIKYFLFLSLLFLSFYQAVSQQIEERPKIGLVLSGGGAKGIAHIGIIRAMEEAGLTPDYVTGTSIGSIVGGLYSIGYTADDIEKVVAQIDWDEMLSNNIPLDEITFEEKQYYGRYIGELQVDGIKVGLPKGLIEGQKLSEVLSRLTRSVHDIENFNDFPIPFACVAADIATGEPVVLNKGSLPEAIRASMAIPTIFTPVELNGRLLVDGGLVRNFPVEEVKAMGADIVIGVFVSTGLLGKEELNNLLSLLSQSAFVTSAFDSRRQKKMVDIYVEPDIKDYTPGSFKQWEQILEKGNEKGQEYVETFKKLADSLKQMGPLNVVNSLPLKDEYLITSITIEGNKKISSKLIKGKLRIEEGSILSVKEIEKQISVVYGTRFFEKVTYEIIRDGPKHELKIKVRETSDGKLKLAVHFDGENDIGINANITYRNLLLPHSRSLLEFDFSESPRLDLNFLKYIGEKQNAGIIVGLDFGSNELPFFEDNINISTLDADYTNLYLQLQSTSFLNFTFGGRAQLEYTELTPKVGELVRQIQEIKNRDVGVIFFIKYNSFDRQFYPKKGIDFKVSLKKVFDVKNRTTQINEDSISTTKTTIEQQFDPYVAIETYFTYIFKVSNRFSIITKNTVVLTTLGEPDFNITDYYFLGGFNPRFKHVSEYWGATDKEYISPNYFYTKLVLQYEMFDNFFISGIANYMDVQYPMELFYDITVDDFLGGERRRIGFGLSIGYNSPLGPISFSLAKDTKNTKVHTNFNVGFWF
ncbi:MAG: patatin-like phospholipase family protein [Cyclobacteriaceae bacterium]|nr:patatin-like phospholipase family protein [Cyclobacteriaceae bacterium]